MKKLPLHTRILIGLVAGLVFGLVSIFLPLPSYFTISFIKPVGTIFVNALKMIAMPLILASLITGIANLGDISKLSKIGGRTIVLYLATTLVATTIGLFMVNIVQPGRIITPETRSEILELYSGEATVRTGEAKKIQEQGPLDPLVKIVPENFFSATNDNANMLQVVFFAIIFGVALLQVPQSKSKPVLAFFDGVNEVVLKIIHFIMLLAPFGVFALIASLIVEIAGDNPGKAFEILSALLVYGITVMVALAIHIFTVYFSLIKFVAKKNFKKFLQGIREAQLLASCYRTCLALAEERDAATISFPSISTGVYGYPVQEAAPIALGEVSKHLSRPGGRVREVIFVLFAQSDYDVYRQALEAARGAKVE